MLNDSLAGGQRRAARLVAPYRAHFVITHKCNLACSHCYQAEHDSDDLTTAEVNGVLGELARLGCLFLVLGGGEPLVRRDFWEILAEARRLRFSVTVYTNGMQVTEEVARRLKDSGVTELSVSLHGAHADTHDTFVRRRGGFDRVNRAIDAATAVGLPVTIKSNVTTLSYREVPALVQRFAGRAGVRLSLNVLVFPKDDGDRSPTMFHMTEAQESEKVRFEVGNLARPELEATLARARRSLAGEESEHVPCQATRSAVAIQPNGDVTPCTQTAGVVMGNVKQRTLAEIWQSSAAGSRFRAIHLDDFTRESPEPCGSCELRKLCQRCPAMSQAESGSLTGYSPQMCQSTKVYWRAVRDRATALGIESPV